MNLQMPNIPIQTEYVAFNGGLNQMASLINVPPGYVIDATNFEQDINGGYRRIAGFERYDGQTSPHEQNYYTASATITGGLALGDTLTGDTSLAAATIVGTDLVNIYIAKITGTFQNGEVVSILGTPVATLTSTFGQGGAPSSALDAEYRVKAADVYRALIQEVPGSGAIRGVAIYDGDVYAWRDNAGGTACVMHKASGSGWSALTLGSEITFGPNTSTVTITIASPGVVSWTAHGLANGHAVTLTTTGALPTGLTANTTYYVVNRAANTFQLSATSGGAAINTTGTQSGTHTALAAGVQIADGATITGAVSGATATVLRGLIRTGSWTASPVGSLVINTVVGTFQSGEALQVSSDAGIKSSSTVSAITLTPGGRYTTVNYAFGANLKMYGADGMNRCFEYGPNDLGTDVFVPIRTGMTTDTPTYIAAHKKHLFLSFGNGSVQHSSIALPYQWSPITGAAEINVGYDVTGLLSQVGSESSAAMMIFTRQSVNILYGNSSADWQLSTLREGIGAIARSVQSIGIAYALDDRGIINVQPSQNWGNFEQATLSRLYKNYIQNKKSRLVASCVNRERNQYRLFFSDGSGVYLTLNGAEPMGAIPVEFGGKVVSCVYAEEMADGSEMTVFGGTDGYVYHLDVGPNFDGDMINAYISLPFNSLKSPRFNKRYRKIILDGRFETYTQLRYAYQLGYGKSTILQPTNEDIQLSDGYATWDSSFWDTMIWGGGFTPPEVVLNGTAENIQMIFQNNSAYVEPFTLSGAILHYNVRRLLR